MTCAEYMKRHRDKKKAAAAALVAQAAIPQSPTCIAPIPATSASGAHASPSRPSSAIASTAEACEALAVLQKAQIDVAVREGATLEVQGKLTSAYSRTLAELRRHRGEKELTETTVVRSVHFKRVLQKLVAAIEPWPDAVAAAADFFAREYP